MADNESSDAVADDGVTEQQAEAILADAVARDIADKQQQSSADNDGSESPDDLKAELARWKKMARKYEENARHNSDAAAKLQEIEDQKKSVEQRLNEQLTSARDELAAYKAREVAQKAAADAGLPLSMTKFISASDPGDAAEQAKELAKHLKAAQPQQQDQKADLRQGARQPARERPTVDAWLRQQAGRA